jgi:DNA-binding response OmpR family regulator
MGDAQCTVRVVQQGLEMTLAYAGDPASKRILIVEDEPFVALSLVDALSELGFDVAGWVGDVRAAIDFIGREHIDGALLDVHLGSQRVDPVADLLAARACPFFFTTGLGRVDVPAAHADRAFLQKPFGTADLASMLDRVFGSGGRPSGS